MHSASKQSHDHKAQSSLALFTDERDGAVQ